MSGVEIQLSVQDAENGNQEGGSDTENDRGESPATPRAAGTTSRVQGQLSLSDTSPSRRLNQITVPAQLMRLLGHAGLRRLLTNHRTGGTDITLQLSGDDDDESEDAYIGPGTRRRRKVRESKNNFPPIPSEEGRRLMDGGVFGSNECYRDRRIKRKTRLARKLLSRESGTDPSESTRATNSMSQV